MRQNQKRVKSLLRVWTLGVTLVVLPTACKDTPVDKAAQVRSEADTVLGDADITLSLARNCDDCDTSASLQTTLVAGKTAAFQLDVPGSSVLNRDRWLVRPDGSAICYEVRGTGDGGTKTTRHDFGPGAVFGPDGLHVDFLAKASNCKRIVVSYDPLKIQDFSDRAAFEAARAKALAQVKKQIAIDTTCRGCDTPKIDAGPVGITVSRGDGSADTWIIRGDGSAICFADDTRDNRWRAYRHPPRALATRDMPITRVVDYLFCRRNSPEAAMSFVSHHKPSGPVFKSVVDVTFDLLKVRGAQGREAIEDVIWDATPAFEACHDAQLRRQGRDMGRRDTGRVMASWTIQLNGRVKDLSVYDSLTHVALRQCLTQVFQSLRFKPPGRVEAYVKVPIELRVE